MSKTRTYRSQMTVMGAVALGSALFAGFLGGRLVDLADNQTSFWIIFIPLLGICAFAFAAVMPWWRKLDDLQKAGQLNAWYWGGQIGGVVVLMALVAATGQNSDYSRGGLALFLGEAAGFGIAWLVWRWRSRGPAE